MINPVTTPASGADTHNVGELRKDWILVPARYDEGSRRFYYPTGYFGMGQYLSDIVADENHPYRGTYTHVDGRTFPLVAVLHYNVANCDGDVKHGVNGPENLRRLFEANGDEPPEVTVGRTKSGGTHAYLRVPDSASISETFSENFTYVKRIGLVPSGDFLIGRCLSHVYNPDGTPGDWQTVRDHYVFPSREVPAWLLGLCRNATVPLLAVPEGTVPLGANRNFAAQAWAHKRIDDIVFKVRFASAGKSHVALRDGLVKGITTCNNRAEYAQDLQNFINQIVAAAKSREIPKSEYEQAISRALRKYGNVMEPDLRVRKWHFRSVNGGAK